MSDRAIAYVVDSKARMATQKYAKVRAGQAIGSQSGVDFDSWFHCPIVTANALKAATSKPTLSLKCFQSVRKRCILLTVQVTYGTPHRSHSRKDERTARGYADLCQDAAASRQQGRP